MPEMLRNNLCGANHKIATFHILCLWLLVSIIVNAVVAVDKTYDIPITGADTKSDTNAFVGVKVPAAAGPKQVVLTLDELGKLTVFFAKNFHKDLPVAEHNNKQEEEEEKKEDVQASKHKNEQQAENVPVKEEEEEDWPYHLLDSIERLKVKRLVGRQGQFSIRNARFINRRKKIMPMRAATAASVSENAAQKAEEAEEGGGGGGVKGKLLRDLLPPLLENEQIKEMCEQQPKKVCENIKTALVYKFAALLTSYLLDFCKGDETATVDCRQWWRQFRARVNAAPTHWISEKQDWKEMRKQIVEQNDGDEEVEEEGDKQKGERATTEEETQRLSNSEGGDQKPLNGKGGKAKNGVVKNVLRLMDKKWTGIRENAENAKSKLNNNKNAADAKMPPPKMALFDEEKNAAAGGKKQQQQQQMHFHLTYLQYYRMWRERFNHITLQALQFWEPVDIDISVDISNKIDIGIRANEPPAKMALMNSLIRNILKLGVQSQMWDNNGRVQVYGRRRETKLVQIRLYFFFFNVGRTTGVNHAGVLIDGTEFHFSNNGGIELFPKGHYSAIHNAVYMRDYPIGQTTLSESELQSVVDTLGESQFAPGTYRSSNHENPNSCLNFVRALANAIVVQAPAEFPLPVQHAHYGTYASFVTAIGYDTKFSVYAKKLYREDNKHAMPLGPLDHFDMLMRSLRKLCGMMDLKLGGVKNPCQQWKKRIIKQKLQQLLKPEQTFPLENTTSDDDA